MSLCLGFLKKHTLHDHFISPNDLVKVLIDLDKSKEYENMSYCKLKKCSENFQVLKDRSDQSIKIIKNVSK